MQLLKGFQSKAMTQSIEDEMKARDISFQERLAASERKVIPHKSREVHTNSPRHGLAGVVKNKFLPREAKPRVVGICFLPQLLNHKWGIGMNLE